MPLEWEERWLTIVYSSGTFPLSRLSFRRAYIDPLPTDNKFKLVHVVATTRETAHLWHRTLVSLYVLRRSVMCGLVSPARMWERHYWSGADMSRDNKLEMEEVVRLCRRLNFSIRREELFEWFKVSV